MKIIAQTPVYNEGQYLERAITPWLNVCERIDILEGSFHTLRNLGFPPRSTDDTIEVARDLAHKHENITLELTNAMHDPTQRNDHLFQVAKEFGREDTVLFMLDADEVYTPEEVQKCVKQVTEQFETHNRWWVNFKNFFRDEQTYYLGFHVPRFSKLADAVGIENDNHVYFKNGVRETDILDVLPAHYSWVGLEKCKQKIDWQNSFRGLCSFKITNNQIDFNDDYYRMTGKQKPTLLKV